ncbi:mechanosensitive ion channel family protein [Actinopolymorpha sp. B11F2]|uniref:mechanosensitive ion channel family protein n=1 Tax=Actinopolymorpha sp. B11F2 TaxID=3160862 RepID=UPI0032E36BD4
MSRVVYALTWSQFADKAEVPARIVFLLILGVLIRLIVNRLIDRLVSKTAGLAPPKHFFGSERAAKILSTNATLYHERRAQRAQALGSLFKSVTTVVTASVIVLMILEILGYPLGPVLASAGVVGVALGFGAQNLVKDVISGVFMLLEDQYGVGDIIDMGEAVGTVEGVGLRVTRLRGFDGVLWHVRNGEVIRIGNRSQGWSSLLLDVEVAPDEDIPQVEELINGVAQAIAEDDAFRDNILEVPKVVGIEAVTGNSITLRVIGRCAANQHFGVLRELRLRLKAIFDAEDIRVPAPIWPDHQTGTTGTAAP